MPWRARGRSRRTVVGGSTACGAGAASAPAPHREVEGYFLTRSTTFVELAFVTNFFALVLGLKVTLIL